MLDPFGIHLLGRFGRQAVDLALPKQVLPDGRGTASQEQGTQINNTHLTRRFINALKFLQWVLYITKI